MPRLVRCCIRRQLRLAAPHAGPAQRLERRTQLAGVRWGPQWRAPHLVPPRSGRLLGGQALSRQLWGPQRGKQQRLCNCHLQGWRGQERQASESARGRQPQAEAPAEEAEGGDAVGAGDSWLRRRAGRRGCARSPAAGLRRQPLRGRRRRPRGPPEQGRPSGARSEARCEPELRCRRSPTSSHLTSCAGGRRRLATERIDAAAAQECQSRRPLALLGLQHHGSGRSQPARPQRRGGCGVARISTCRGPAVRPKRHHTALRHC
mmetsp:Transcript_22959/g.53714  ORF Transcript_22959/g.53714 Transcript_22959/m.53714 type:complete len:262 (-) Transcript_22959:23-808(-)